MRRSPSDTSRSERLSARPIHETGKPVVGAPALRQDRRADLGGGRRRRSHTGPLRRARAALWLRVPGRARAGLERFRLRHGGRALPLLCGRDDPDRVALVPLLLQAMPRDRHGAGQVAGPDSRADRPPLPHALQSRTRPGTGSRHRITRHVPRLAPPRPTERVAAPAGRAHPRGPGWYARAVPPRPVPGRGPGCTPRPRFTCPRDGNLARPLGGGRGGTGHRAAGSGERSGDVVAGSGDRGGKDSRRAVRLPLEGPPGRVSVEACTVSR